MNKRTWIRTTARTFFFVALALVLAVTPALATDGSEGEVVREATQTVTLLEAQANSFPDIQGIEHESDVRWLDSTGISKGFPDGTFRPNISVARCDMAAFLHRLAQSWGLAKNNGGAQNKAVFEDVTEDTPHAADIWWLAEAGISKGWDLGGGRKQFRPYETVARQDMAAFLFRLAKIAGLGGASDSWTANSASRTMFYDVDGADAYNHHVEVWWLAQTRISTGWQVGNKHEFRGLSPVARQDMAAFLHRLNGLDRSDTETPEIPL